MEEEIPHHHMRWKQMNEGGGGWGRRGEEWGCVERQMQIWEKNKIKGEEGEGQKIK